MRSRNWIRVGGLLFVLFIWASVAKAQGGGVCPVSGGVSVLGCGACTSEQRTDTVTRHEKRPCPPGFTGDIVTEWDETWFHDIVCTPVGNGQCGQVHRCDPVLGWILVGGVSGPFTEEVQVDNATMTGRSANRVHNRCIRIPVPVGPIEFHEQWLRWWHGFYEGGVIFFGPA